MIIDEGIYGDVDLGGLHIAALFKWPGPIHEGKGEALAYVDERADEAQRAALLTIMTGGDTDPFATVFAVFASTIGTMYEPRFVPFDLERFFAVHFAKVAPQTRLLLASTIQDARRLGLPYAGTQDLAERLRQAET